MDFLPDIEIIVQVGMLLATVLGLAFGAHRWFSWKRDQERTFFIDLIKEVRTEIKESGARLERRMDKRFDQVDKRIDELAADIKECFKQIDKRFDEITADTKKHFMQVDK